MKIITLTFIFNIVPCIFFRADGQTVDVFNINTVIDTIVKLDGKCKCKLPEMSSFLSDSLCREYIFSEDQDEVYFNYSSSLAKTIKFYSTVNFLFSWQDSLIVSIAYDTTEQIKNEEQNYIPINFKLFEHLDNEDSVYQYKGTANFNDLFHITKLKEDIPDSAKLSYKDIKNKKGIYWLIDSNLDSKKEEIIFLTIDKNGNSQFIRPVQFWMYMPILTAINFYEKYDMKPTSENNEQHDITITTALKKMGRISNNKSYQFTLKNSNILVAIGYGDKKITELPKWKKLIDFNVFGNYKCMPENYFIPSTDYFAHTYSNPKVSQDSTIILIPLDSAFVHGYNELGNYTMLYNSIEPGFKRKAGFIRQSLFELKRRFDCTGIYGVNQYKYEYNKYVRLGTINNIEYMPGVYFLPDYFKIKSINGLSLEEFTKKQCEK